MKRILVAVSILAGGLVSAHAADPTTASNKMCDAIPSFFDEAWYLQTYPDVAKAVAAYDGKPTWLRCGWQHWWLYGREEGRRMSAN
jgi:hypothetical protein